MFNIGGPLPFLWMYGMVRIYRRRRRHKCRALGDGKGDGQVLGFLIYDEAWLSHGKAACDVFNRLSETTRGR